MKALLAGLILLAGLSAQATSVQMTVNHVLPFVKINGQTSKLVGVALVDFQKNEITMSLYQDPCGSFAKPQPGVMHCMAMPILTNQYTVPLQKRATDACGSVTYAGKEDKRPVDGALTAIQVVDNTNFKCESFAQVNDAEVTVIQKAYDRKTGKELKSTVKAYTNHPY